MIGLFKHAQALVNLIYVCLCPVSPCPQTDLSRFSKLVRMKAFQPFVSAEQALENQNDISEGVHALYIF